MNRYASVTALALALLSAPVRADTAPPARPASSAPVTPPKLIVVISVDQFSADLFGEYRTSFTGGLARYRAHRIGVLRGDAHATTTGRNRHDERECSGVLHEAPRLARRSSI